MQIAAAGISGPRGQNVVQQSGPGSLTLQVRIAQPFMVVQPRHPITIPHTHDQFDRAPHGPSLHEWRT